MSRHVDVEGWIFIALAAGFGFISIWISNLRLVTENTAKVGAYTAVLFTALVMALRPAWRRLRLWIDLGILFAVHVAIVLSLVDLLGSYSIRLNWVIALPIVAIELLLFLGFLCRRNVSEEPGEGESETDS
jgi:hypothetical protein